VHWKPWSTARALGLDLRAAGRRNDAGDLPRGRSRAVRGHRLDPFFHHGTYFMPAATRFLDGFLPWLRESGHRL